MNQIQSFKRFPAVQIWIKNILEGQYSSENKSFFTIFGKIKRVRIVATIVDKREILSAQITENDMLLGEDDHSNLRIEFDLDDSTGLIRAILWQANPDQYIDFTKGDIVDVVGIIRQWKGFTSISPEIIKKVKNPNIILLRNAEIIKKIKFGEIHEIPKISEENFEIEEFSGEIDIDDLFEGDQNFESDDIKEKVSLLIKRHSSEGNGISFKKLKKIMKISEEELRKCLKDLEMESKIYQSEENIYQAF